VIAGPLPVMTLYKKWGRGRFMLERATLTKLLCVAFVAAIMVPLGSLLFPYVSHQLSGIQFQAIEAVISATVGFGIYSAVD
jgi:membrane protein YqaA with SNARE-associated domain